MQLGKVWVEFGFVQVQLVSQTFPSRSFKLIISGSGHLRIDITDEFTKNKLETTYNHNQI